MKAKQDNKEKTSNDEKHMNIAYTVDIQGIGAQQFADQLYVSISSLRKSKKDAENIRVHIFYGNITVELAESLHRLDTDTFHVQLHKIQQSDLNFMQQFTKQNPNSVARAWCGIVYARHWLAKFLMNESRCLYLDADTLVRNSVSDLYYSDLKGKSLGMVMGCIPEYGYNSGVIVMALEKIRKDDRWEQLNEHLRKYALSYFLPDQTVINRFYLNDICELPLKYNYPPRTDIRYNGSKLADSAVIWHFYNGGTKPVRFSESDITKSEWNSYL